MPLDISNGCLLQYGRYTGNESTCTITFPISYTMKNSYGVGIIGLFKGNDTGGGTTIPIINAGSSNEKLSKSEMYLSISNTGGYYGCLWNSIGY